MLMGMLSVHEARVIQASLNTFKRANGLEVNEDKSQIFFFNNPPNNVKEHIENSGIIGRYAIIQIPRSPTPQRKSHSKKLEGASG